MPIFQDIATAAYAKSKKNQPGTTANDTEIKAQVQRIVQGVYAFAAVINPTRFSEVATVSPVALVYPFPPNAEAIIRVEITTGNEEVHIVPYDDQGAELGKPSIYEFGTGFNVAAGATLPLGTEDLDFWYARRPNAPTGAATDLTVPIDPVAGASAFPEAYNELLALELAIYFSRKDGRGNEVQSMSAERDTWATRFASWLQRGVGNERRRFSKRVHNVESLIPLIGGG